MEISANHLQVRLFGRFELRCANKSTVGFEARKAQELLCYLLLHRTRPYLRETLAELLWEKSPDVQIRKCLRQALWKLQAALNLLPVFKDQELLIITADWVQVNPKAPLWLDVVDFEQYFNVVRDISVEKLDPLQVETMQKAVALYHGELLEGLYSDWCLVERERFRDMYLTMLDKLMAHSELNHEYEAGLMYGIRILSYDQTLESVHRRMMRLHYFSGNRTKSLRQYERCARILGQEFGIEPSNRTQELYGQIKADQLEHTRPEVLLTQVEPVPATPNQLKELLNDLFELEARLKYKIQLAEQTIK